MLKLKHLTRGIYLAAFSLILASLISVGLLSGYSQNANALGASTIIDESNKQRELMNVKPLVVSEKLMNAAQAKAENMATERYFSHDKPDGTPPWKFITETGYEYLEAGENLAVTNQADNSVVSGWMNSPTHKQNLLNENFTETGIGIAYFGEYEGHKKTYVVVAFYAKPGKQASVPVNVQRTHPAGELTLLNQKDYFGTYNSFIIAGIILIIIAAVLELLNLRYGRKIKKALHHHHHDHSHKVNKA